MMSPGLLQGLSAYFIWGLFPLYWMWLKHVPATDVMAHRILWSCVTLFVVLAFRGRIKTAFSKLTPRTFVILAVTSLLISGNWLIYIWAVSNNFVLETSFGYYICPLVSMLLGAIFLKERLGRLQYFAISLAFAGVLVLAFSYGRLPWVSLGLALSFGFYALLRKAVVLDAQSAMMIETALLLVPALIYLFVGSDGHAIFSMSDWPTRILLILGGAVTLIPLLLMTASLKTLSLSTAGFLQYISPTLQFVCGIVVFKEDFGTVQLVSFSLIWLGLIVYTLASLQGQRARRVLAK